ncbi:MAG: DUF4167 domain-containing protein [Rhodobacteraceae bacterium]|nr:DUF4167 domain-containing protein [Paracoccaceae bacterium]
MRSSKSRSRSKSNRNRSVGNIVNRVFDSSGPEGKVRGTPAQIIDKYNQLARDAHLGNDRVAAENFQQHAEHYTRMLGEAQREMDQSRRDQQEQQPQGRDDDGSRKRDEDRRQDRRPDDRRNGQPDEARGEERKPDDVIDMGEAQTEDSGLVETPESKPKRERKPRKPRKAPEAAAGEAPAQPDAPAQPEAPETPEAAE